MEDGNWQDSLVKVAETQTKLFQTICEALERLDDMIATQAELHQDLPNRMDSLEDVVSRLVADNVQPIASRKARLGDVPSGDVNAALAWRAERP